MCLINPTDLKYVKYITYDGKRCLLLEIDEDVVVEGFRLRIGNTLTLFSRSLPLL